MDDALGWERALSSQFSADNKRLLVAGVKFGGVGEIAIYSVDGFFFYNCKSSSFFIISRICDSFKP